MKKYNLKYILVFAALSLIFGACEDDTAISAGEGDPLNENVINLDATVASAQTITGEANKLPFTVTLPQSFSSEATVTARIILDSGASTTGTAVIEAGATTGTGSITLPADDDVFSSSGLFGLPDAATLSLIAIALEELETGKAYTISSNSLSLGLYDDTLDPDAGGLNLLLDWENPADNDLDLYVFDATGATNLEFSESGSRYESDLFENTGRADGTYLIVIASYTQPPVGGFAYKLLVTLPTGELIDLDGMIPETFPAGLQLVGTFDKVTDAVTGVVSYENIVLL